MTGAARREAKAGEGLGRAALAVGLLSPLLAALLGRHVYRALTRASDNPDQDYLLRLSLTAAAMALPFLVTLACAAADRMRRGRWARAAGTGLAVAALSLGLTWHPISGALARSRQQANRALEGVPAPELVTADLEGRTHRLSDYRGRVVLLNVWATWCGPCRVEMPRLDALQERRAADGLVVLGLSLEDPERQREFAATKVSVDYPLLTGEGEIPDVFGTIAQYPANFLIDREGLLHPAPSAREPFENLERAVDALLARDG